MNRSFIAAVAVVTGTALLAAWVMREQVRSRDSAAADPAIHELDFPAGIIDDGQSAGRVLPQLSDLDKGYSDAKARTPGGVGPTRIDLTLARERGCHEFVEGPYSDYMTYDLSTLVQLAESGDATARMLASTSQNLDVDVRRKFAEAAASQGYTSALVRFGLSLAGPPLKVRPDQEYGHSPTLGFAYLMAAHELGDPMAVDIASFAPLLGEQSPEDQAESVRLADGIVNRVRRAR